MKKIIFLLCMFLAFPIYSQQSRTVLDSILAEAPSGVSGAITARDYRDFAISAFANTDTSDPTSSDDVDSGYNIGDMWVNTNDYSVWICTDNSSGAAQWEDLTTITEADISDLSHYTDSDISGDEAAFNGWDKNLLDDHRATFKNITADYILSLSDTSKQLMVNSSSTITITIPTEATADFPDGTSIYFWREGSGNVIIKPSPGVTLRSIFDDTATDGDSLRVQNSPYWLQKDDASNQWNGYGDAK